MPLKRFILCSFAALANSAAFAAAHTAGHGHGGGHGHTLAVHHTSMSHSAWAYHNHYHPVYHHRGGDHYYAGNTGNRYNHSPVYMNPLRGEHEITIGAGMESRQQMQDSALRTASPAGFLTYKYYISNGVAFGHLEHGRDAVGQRRERSPPFVHVIGPVFEPKAYKLALHGHNPIAQQVDPVRGGCAAGVDIGEIRQSQRVGNVKFRFWVNPDGIALLAPTLDLGNLRGT